MGSLLPSVFTMAKQLYRQKYNGRRRILAAQDRENRFIVSYLQHKRPDIYNNAKKIYTDLRAKYKGKHDVRKTSEYEELMTGTVKKYKYSKHLTIKDNMVLTIELSDPPVEGSLLDAPVEGPLLDSPVEGPLLDAPVEGPLFDAPVEGPLLDAPVEGPLFDAPVEGPLLDAPVEGPLLDAPVEGPLLDAPVEGPLLDALSDITADLTLPYMTDQTMGELLEDLAQDPTMGNILDSMNDLYDNIFW